MRRRDVSYFREQLDYKNVVRHGEITEAVIFKTPDLSYKFQIFILHNGKQGEKLYRRSLSGAKKIAYKRLGLVHKNTQPVFQEYKPKLSFVNFDGKKVAIPEYMEIPIRGQNENHS